MTFKSLVSKSLCGFAFVAIFSSAFPSLTCHAQTSNVPRLIRYRGNLGVSAPVGTDHVISITFNVYSNQSSGESLWNETQQVQIAPDGAFEVLLGAASSDGLPLELFRTEESRWLGITPQGMEELPRILLVSVPFALHAADADTLAGIPASAYARQPQDGAPFQPRGNGETTNIKASETSLLGTPNYLAKFLDAATISTSSVIETALGLGVDVPSPTQKLDVSGRIKLRSRAGETSGLWLTNTNGDQSLFVGQTDLESRSPFGIWHGDAWRFTLTSAGDLGLGVGKTPISRFDMSGRAVIRASEQGTAGIWLTGANGLRDLFVGQLGINSGDPFGVWHGGFWRLIVDRTGNVGIGGPPQFPLDLRGRMLLRASGTQPSGMWFSGVSDMPQLFVGQTDTMAAAPFGILHGNDWRFILMSNGNVGLGTTTPTEKLEIAGNLKLSSSGRLIFPDGTFMSSAFSTASIRPLDASIQITASGNESQLAVAPSGVTSAKLADGSVIASKIADGAVTATKLSGGIPPAAITGTAATLGANSFSGPQTMDGSLNVTGPFQVSGASQLSSTIITTNNAAGYALDATNSASTGTPSAIRATSYSGAGGAVYATAMGTSGNASGVYALTYAPQGMGIYAEGTSTTEANFGVVGRSRSGKGTGVLGESLGASGTNYGVVGRASGDNYSAGVLAEATATSTVWNTYGVLARNSGKNGIGVYALASHLTGNTYGLYGRVDSPAGVAGMFMTSATSGNVLIASNATKRLFRLDASGNLFVAGTLNQGGADYAESIAVSGDRRDYEPGDVLVIDEDADRQVAISNRPYATNVAGVFSTRPGTLGSLHEMGANPTNEIPVAMVGIVPCKVSTENGPIRRGDLLVTSSKPGYAMRGTDRSLLSGAIIGKAMQSLTEGSGIIEVMVSLQ
jgi:hypothetical protein